MRIFGGHDYYDSALAYGHDPSVVFERSEEKFISRESKPNPKFQRKLLKAGIYDEPCDVRVTSLSRKEKRYHDGFIDSDGRRCYLYTRQIVFCGHRYFGVKAKTVDSFLPEKVEYFWGEESFVKFLKSHGQEIRKNYISWRDDENHLFQHRPCTSSEIEWLVENRVSILVQSQVGRNNVWLVDPPKLKELMFYRVMDAATAFQELDMWLSGVLGRESKPLVEISDKDRIHKHGYDKWSFRRHAEQ